jgi:hypothetical protein
MFNYSDKLKHFSHSELSACHSQLPTYIIGTILEWKATDIHAFVKCTHNAEVYENLNLSLFPV